ncbi:MAG TPA: uracil phosphoribosyltransferase [Chryseolinea sp.]|nr:uracil phosphoribosyltransferase [Chryseolinea sp.]
MVFNISEENTVANQFIAQLRDRSIQADRMKFRKNLERLGQIMAYEISRRLTYHAQDVETPLGKATMMLLEKDPVLFTVLRAGLPFFQGFLDYFDRADCGFVGAYRKEGGKEVVIQLDYVASPGVTDRDVIIVDPMLATGKSMVQAIDAILKVGRPRHVYIASLVAVQEGIAYIDRHVSIPHSICTCALDQRLDERFYIIPGLGDAGDLSFGEKL